MFYAFRDTIYELAKMDKRIILISVDQDVGLSHLQFEMPDQFFMEGISEANAIGMASGLAADGFRPFILNHASFLTRRCYEQIVLDACLQERPIRLVGMGSGLATAHLGPTHTIIEDIAIMRAIPGMTVIAPCDAVEMKKLMPHILKWPKPVYIRLARYGKPIVTRDEGEVEIGKAVVLYKGESSKKNVLLISTGAMTLSAIKAVEELKEAGIECTVLHVHTIKPLDKNAIIELAQKAKLIVTLEDHTIIGGLGSACLEVLMDNINSKDLPQVHRMGLPDKFIHEYGTQESLMEEFGLQPAQIANRIIKFMKK